MKNICLALMTAVILCSFTFAPAFARDTGKRDKPHHGSEMKKPDHQRPDVQRADNKRPDVNRHDDKIHTQKKPEHRYDKRNDNRSPGRDRGKLVQGKDRSDKRSWDKREGKGRYDGRHSQNRQDYRR